MTNDLSAIRHEMSEEIQYLIKAKEQAENEIQYNELNEIIRLKKEQFQIILESELGENQEEYKEALQVITESVSDVKLALEGMTTMAAALVRKGANRQGGFAAAFLNNNRNKKSVAINLKDQRGKLRTRSEPRQLSHASRNAACLVACL